MGVLNPLSENRLDRDRRITEHVLGTPQGTHGVVVDVEAEAVSSEPDAHPVQVADDRVASLEHPVQNVVDVLGGVVVTHHGDGRVSGATDDQESTDPHVVGEQTDLGRVVDSHVRIGRHGVHVLSHDDAQRTKHRQVHTQLGVPGGGQELIETVVTVGSGEQQGISLLTLVDLLDGMTDAPVRPVHVTGDDEQDGNRHMVVGDVGHPQTAGDRIQSTFEGEEVAVGSPVTGEEGSDPCTDAGIKLCQQVLIEELVRQRDVRHGGDGFAIEHQRLAGVDGIHQLADGSGHVNEVTSPGQ